MYETSEKRGLTGNALKLIAIITMFIDHAAALLIENGYFAVNENPGEGTPGFILASRLLTLDIVCRAIGRIAFPIFLFLLVEGFLHTSNLLKYGVRLLLFAVISEVPFDLANNGSVLEFGYQNVFFTLFLTLVAMAGYEAVENRFWKNNKVPAVLLYIVIFLAATTAASLLRADYASAGVGMGSVIWFLRKKRSAQPLALMAFIIVYCILQAASVSASGTGPVVSFARFYFDNISFIEVLCVAAYLFITRYNGERGSFLPKYVFYAFYPVHMLILTGIRYLIFNV